MSQSQFENWEKKKRTRHNWIRSIAFLSLVFSKSNVSICWIGSLKEIDLSCQIRRMLTPKPPGLAKTGNEGEAAQTKGSLSIQWHREQWRRFQSKKLTTVKRSIACWAARRLLARNTAKAQFWNSGGKTKILLVSVWQCVITADCIVLGVDQVWRRAKEYGRII